MPTIVQCIFFKDMQIDLDTRNPLHRLNPFAFVSSHILAQCDKKVSGVFKCARLYYAVETEIHPNSVCNTPWNNSSVEGTQ